MNVEVEDRIKRDPANDARIARAVRLLEDELGPSRDHVAADWIVNRDNQGKEVFELRVIDSAESDSARSRFTHEELGDEELVRSRIHRLWGDILQARSHKQLERLHRMVLNLGEAS